MNAISKEEPKDNPRPPLPPFDHDAAVKKVRLAEDGWNSRNPEKVSAAYTVDSVWRNRSESLRARKETPNGCARR